MFERIHQLLRYTRTSSGVMWCVVFVRQFVHLTTYFFIAAQFNHVLAELLITDEPVVNTQEMSLLAFLLERIGDVVFSVAWLLPVTVPVGRLSLYSS